MTTLEERIAQFQKMATEDPDNELGHFRLGQLYLEAGQFDNAVASFRRTLELSPHFSKVYELLGQALLKLDRKDEAVDTLKKGYAIAAERGDNIPRDNIAKLLAELGEEIPQMETPAATAGEDTGFRCARPGCMAGRHARQLPAPPFNDELGQQIYEKVCADCWQFWLRDWSIKVINEMRLDLSTERGQQVYDQMMKETLGLS